MSWHGFLFYVLAAVTVMATILAIMQRQVVATVVYLIISFLTTALIFYLLGAPLLAALEVIIYAGAIMVLFLFIVMTMIVRAGEDRGNGGWRRWWPAVVLSTISFYMASALIFAVPRDRTGLQTLMASPISFGRFLFDRLWFPVEVASFLLLIALVGALYLGRQEKQGEGGPPGGAT